MTYTELKKEYVIETIAKGSTVIVCDFLSYRMMNCIDMTVGGIQNYIDNPETKFFKAVPVENE